MASSLSPRRSSRPGARDRHGRGIRAAVTGPHLPALRTRVNVFDGTVAGAAGYLRDMWPHELGDVRFEVAAMPETATAGTRVDRWVAVPEQQRIVLFRLPIERFARLHRRDELHRRMVIESCVFRAVADYLGKDPWELSPDHFGHRH